MDSCIVTVFIITYNHHKTISKAIESVLEQKTSFGYKIVVLDDASTDGTTDIVSKYAEKYPDKISAIIQAENIGVTENVFNGIKTTDTKYFALLEGDDYWCDQDKLQLQVEALENNPDCSFCAHNTLKNYVEQNIQTKYLNSASKKFTLPDKIPGKKYIEPHISSRLIRTQSIDFGNIKNHVVLSSDIAMNFYLITKGNLIYIDRIMSVYNYTGEGTYSGIDGYAQRYKSAKVIDTLNQEFDYKYNYILSGFFAKVLSVDILTYYSLRYFTPCKNLKNKYEKLLKNFKTKYLNNYDVKPFFKISIPLSKKKNLVFELKREKIRT